MSPNRLEEADQTPYDCEPASSTQIGISHYMHGMRSRHVQLFVLRKCSDLNTTEN